VNTEVTEAGPFERTLTVHLDEAELDAAEDRAARKLSQEIKVKGFRPGKAPRAIIESMVGAERLRTEAIEEALPEVVTNALIEEELAPVTTPAVEDIRDGEDGGVAIDVRITLWPSVESVPSYVGREVVVDVASVDDVEIEEQIDRFRNQYADLEEVARPADTGDYVMVNITALDGDDLIEEVSASDLLYEVGSSSFIAGLDEILLGSSAGDIREGPGTLPEGFSEGVSGEVTLRALVKEVRGKKLPELTDEWVSDVSEFESVAELQDRISTNMQAMKASTAAGAFQEQLVTELADELDIELPAGLVDAEVEASLHNLQHSLEAQGLDLNNYLQVTGQDPEAFLADLRERAQQSLRTRVLLEAVASDAELEVEAEEIDAAVVELSAQSEQDADEVRAALVESGQIQALAGDILRRKALDLVLKEAAAVDADGNPVDLTPPASNLEDEVAEDDVSEADANETDEAPKTEPTEVATEDAGSGTEHAE
jgi:trigger factor